MEGIETMPGPGTRFDTLHVSRCPDMEGIETTVLAGWCICTTVMSVGAPTWRGLKQQDQSMADVERMSVGAPTWRGLKLSKHFSSLLPTLHVSRCPDMEGIETCKPCFACRGSESMSVGAPTWRGLKHGHQF